MVGGAHPTGLMRVFRVSINIATAKSAQAAAQLTIANHNVLKLSAEGSRAFADAILNPNQLKYAKFPQR
jgi:uncharacterized protein (DUF1778 family)